MPALPVLILVIVAIVVVAAPALLTARVIGRNEPRRDPAALLGEPFASSRGTHGEPFAAGAMPAR
jgi:hypothetical protein